MTANDDKNLAVLSHALGILTGFIGPLVIWLVVRQNNPFVEAESREALNFQITMNLAILICTLLSCLVIPALLIPAIYLFTVIMCVLAAVKVANGESFQYPLTLRLVS